MGRDLLDAARIRAQVKQIEQYQAAARAFELKYNDLAGDLATTKASSFGLSVGSYITNNRIFNMSYSWFMYGEAPLFWVHLSEAGMIEGRYSYSAVESFDTNLSGAISNYLPTAKIGDGKYIYVWSGGPDKCHSASVCAGTNGKNYFSIDNLSRFCGRDAAGCGSGWYGSGTLSVVQTYRIDQKMDDGMPQSGIAQAFILKNGMAVGEWAGDFYSGAGAHKTNSPEGTTDATPRSSTNCYDNNNTAGQPQQYSIATNNGENLTCGLSIRFN